MLEQSLEQRLASYRECLQPINQSHLLRFWPELDDGRRRQLLHDLDQVPFQHIQPLIESHVRHKPHVALPGTIQPPTVLPAEPEDARRALYVSSRKLGEDAIRAGRVAAFTVAGGQGTRLGFDGPKGAFPISPIRNATLFQWFAESLLGARRRYGKLPRWYIMTSPANHEETVTFFREHSFFGLSQASVFFFQQGQMPAFFPDGRIVLADKHRIALSPNGHGGSLQALADSGALADMRHHAIEIISYFQVDNPLVHTLDPLFIGLHMSSQSEMSSKAVKKIDALEKVGNFCAADGKLMVIEYSDLPESLARAVGPDNSRLFDAGSIAIHLLDRAFVERLTAVGAAERLPWHRAEKKVPYADDAGGEIHPDKPNAIKLEMFVFDAIPLARNPIVLEVNREEEFSPVKNAEGADSPATTRRDLIRRGARWLDSCGVLVPKKGDIPCDPVEISPTFALDVSDLKNRIAARKIDATGPLLLTT